MYRNRIKLSLRDMNRRSIPQYSDHKMLAEISSSIEVNLSPDQLNQFDFRPGESNRSELQNRREFDHDTHIAVRAKIVRQGRCEK